MNIRRLLVGNLLYHWRGHVAVLLGVILGTAVLTGALAVGDSLRGSLRSYALDRLGPISQAVTANRFFRASVAKDLGVRPALLLQASATTPGGASQVGKVTVLGLDRPLSDADAAWTATGDKVAVNAALATALGIKAGDKITLQVAKRDAIPRESLLGKRQGEDVADELVLTVAVILPGGGTADFTIAPTAEPVRNVFVPLPFLQEQLGLGERINALLAEETTTDLNAALAKDLDLEDWNLLLRTPRDRALDFVKFLDPRNETGKLKKARWLGRVPETLAAQANTGGELTIEQIVEFYEKERPYVALESRSLYLDDTVTEALSQARGNWQAERVLIYLVDTLLAGGANVPYVVVAGIDDAALALKGNEIALAEWPGSPLNVHKDDPVSLIYYVPDVRGGLQKEEHASPLAKTLPVEGKWDDPDWTPTFPGITDQQDIAQWQKPPFPYDNRRVTPADESYWKRYRATPRAYVSLATAQKLWGSRYGNLTSVRLTPPAGTTDLAAATHALSQRLLANLPPARGGFVFVDLRERALKGGAGATDFGEYFLSFSFFLIIAALLLVGLLVRLNIERRAREIGILLAVGWTPRRVRLLIFAEGSLVVLVGAGLGLAGAVLYADLLLRWLKAEWPSGSGLPFLELHVSAQSLLAGYLASCLVSIFTLWWGTRVLTRVAPRALLTGETQSAASAGAAGKWSLRTLRLSLVGALGSMAAGFFAQDEEGRAMSFFGCGALVLTASLAWSWRRLHVEPTSEQSFYRAGLPLARLGARNAARNPLRSLLTAGLLASATFMIASVQSFQKGIGPEMLGKNGGTGGYSLYVETDVPIFPDFNDKQFRAEHGMNGPEWQKTKIASFRLKPGDDASCLNLYVPARPRILGAPSGFLAEGRFHFADTQASGAEKDNPWLLLEKPALDGTIPVIADKNTADWILKVGLGDIIEITGDDGKPARLKLVALLESSIFQSELVMSEVNFLKVFPKQEGYNFFLIQPVWAGNDDLIATSNGPSAAQVDAVFAGLGARAHAESTLSRLSAFFAVENMYLATFQALGALGLLLGVVGLAIVLLRGVWERRGELALLAALGYRQRSIGWLVLAENLLLLILGIAAGGLAAACALAPHEGLAAFLKELPRLALFLTLIGIVGLVSCTVAVLTSLRTPILTALRKE